MTERETVGAFLALVTEHPDIGAEFVRARSLMQQARAINSTELAEAAGFAFAEVCDRVGEIRGRTLDASEIDILEDMVKIPPTALERPN